MDERTALLALHLQRLGPIRSRRLIEEHGSAVSACNQLHIATDWERELTLAEQLGVEIITHTDPHYPQSLLQLRDYPLLIYVKGKLALQRPAALIGTRNATPYGLQSAHQLARNLAAQGQTIISGLARGIDTAAHRGALETGKTVAILGSGLARVYPPENVSLSEQIAVQGAVVTEFPLTVGPERPNFPQRNRLVAALSQSLVLVEAPLKSGAMLTMAKGAALKKPLYALPGRTEDPTFAGNLQLLHNGTARLIRDAKDLFEEEGDLMGRLKRYNRLKSAASIRTG